MGFGQLVSFGRVCKVRHVAGQGHHSTRAKDAVHFGEESGQVEPMACLVGCY